MRFGIVGAGSWGTALAHLFSGNGHEVALWARRPELAEEIAHTRRNPAYLPDLRLHDSVRVTADLEVAVAAAELVVFAVPTTGMRAVATAAAPWLPRGARVVSAAKGFEHDSTLTMTRVLGEVLPEGTAVLALSGPNLAAEVARGLPAATVVACADGGLAASVRAWCSSTQLRCYSQGDVIGVEYGGALKNVVAIAAGTADGLGAGDNGKAAIITRGIAEMTRLGVRAGANPRTFAGLAGIGDCIVTCMSPLSRNRRLGEALGSGRTVAEAQAGSPMVAEGINAARAAQLLGRQYGEDLPIVDAVCAVLFEGRSVASALETLLRRDPRDEAPG